MPRPPSPAPRHLPGTEVANLVETPSLTNVKVGLETIQDSGGAITVDGPPGTGKTFAADVIYHQLNIEGYWVAMPYKPRGKETTARIHEALTGQPVKMRTFTEYELLCDIVDYMSGRHVVLAIDEAQHLTATSLNQLRYLYDHTDTKLVLLLVGAGLDKAIQRNCEPLRNRVERRVAFKHYKATEMARFLKDYHPMFANSTTEVIRLIIDAAGGSVRTAATILKTALNLCEQPEQGITEKEARAVLRLINGVAA